MINELIESLHPYFTILTGFLNITIQLLNRLLQFSTVSANSVGLVTGFSGTQGREGCRKLPQLLRLKAGWISVHCRAKMKNYRF